MILATDDPDVVSHLAEALRDHARRCQAEGREIPPDVVRLAAWLWSGDARRRLGPTTSAERFPSGADSAQDADVPAALDYRAAAARLNVSVRTVQRQVAAGRLAAVRLGRTVRIPVESIDAFLAETAA